MTTFFRILMAALISISVAQFPLASFAQEEVTEEGSQDNKEETDAKAIEQAWAKKCVAAQKTSKDKKASDEDRADAKKIYKECKKEARKKERAQCIPTSTRINRC